jgi:RNA polymerase sigma-70 factor (ECF subfamily)
MTREKMLAETFDANRRHLKGVAYRMLGSAAEADDAVQEAWLRFSRTDVSEVGNPGGWLTTVVARICLDMLRSRKSRREEPLEAREAEPIIVGGADPEQEMVMADSVGLALMVVLQKLAPAERIALVLHDMFDFSFDEIAPIVGRSEAAARQLASRARRRVQGTDKLPEAELSENRRIVDAFLAASRAGDLDGLMAVLDPEVVVGGDAAALRLGGARLSGADATARYFTGRAQSARPALVDGAVGIVVAPAGKLLIAIAVTIRNGRITSLQGVAEPEHLRQVELALLR